MRYSLIFLSFLAASTSVAIPLNEAKAIFARAASTLNAGMVARGKQYFGACADSYTLKVSANADILKNDFGQVTPENSMKWTAIEPERGNFKYETSDVLVNFAVDNGKIIRGHTLLWYQQLPGWVEAITDKYTLTSVLQNHISNVVGKYKGKIAQWDVINEIFNEDGTLRSFVFTNLLGEEVVRIAFEAARKADPQAVLYINDYGLHRRAAKRAGIISYVKKWKAEGIPIDGIGTQAHLLSGDGAGPDFQGHLAELASVGVQVAITELDVRNASPEVYKNVVTSCLNEAACVGITTWGVADLDSWRADLQPLLYDNNYQAKPARQAILDVLALDIVPKT